MNKLLLALLILGAGLLGVCGWRRTATQARASGERHRAELIEATNLWAKLEADVSALRQGVKHKKICLSQAPPLASVSPAFLEALQKGAGADWPQTARKELREQLGIAWDNSSNYVLVSKAALKEIGWFSVIDRQGALTAKACGVYSITSGERAAIEEALRRADAEHTAWLQTNVFRVPPSGDIVAEYVIPADREVAQRLREQFAEAATATLGPERFALLKEILGTSHFERWGTLAQQKHILTVRRYWDGPQQRLSCWDRTEQSPATQGEGATGSFGDVSARSPMPALFEKVFLGGWREIAQREGFELLEEVQNPPSGR